MDDIQMKEQTVFLQWEHLNGKSSIQGSASLQFWYLSMIFVAVSAICFLNIPSLIPLNSQTLTKNISPFAVWVAMLQLPGQ
jgi:hypothetical protein